MLTPIEGFAPVGDSSSLPGRPEGMPTVVGDSSEDEAEGSSSSEDEAEIPFLYLCEHGLVRAAHDKLVEDHEARSIVDAEGRSGLHLAALNGELRMVQLLLGQQTQSLATSNWEGTVQIPAEAKFTSEELLECTLVDDYDNTPLSYVL